jgi:hypothetical protein
MTKPDTTNRNLLSMLLAVGILLFIMAVISVGYPIAAFDYRIVTAYWFHNRVLNYDAKQ